MPADVEAAGEALYKASRYWEYAGEEWEAAATWLPEATISSFTLGLAYGGAESEFAAEYNACVYEIRARVKEGADNLHASARSLRTAADEYVEIDEELRRKFDDLAPDVEPPPEEPYEPGPLPGVPH